MIPQREKTSKVFITQDNGGHVSPLQPIKSKIVAVIVQMAQIRQCLAPSQGVQLLNSMIDGTNVQKELIQFKNKYSHGIEGKIGRGYWRSFKKRNAHLICSK